MDCVRANRTPQQQVCANSFVGNSYEKSVRKSFRSHSYDLLNLKSFVFTLFRKMPGEGVLPRI